MNNYIAIMAGGVGSRFWPSSRESLPKQFLDILGTGESLIQATFNRCLNLVPASNILVVTNKMYKDLVAEHLPEIPLGNILCEPSRNNTAPCVAYTALRINALDPNASMVILPSDHVIEKEDAFVEALQKAFDFAKAEDALLTLGIEPTRPDTGYGYIEMSGDGEIRKVQSFKEKPDVYTAEEYLKTGGFVWNAGIFIWSVKSILKAFDNNANQIISTLAADMSKYGTEEEQDYIDAVYPNTEKISVDYAIMERSDNVYTIPVDIGWSDLGTWASLHDLLSRRTQNDLVALGRNKLIESSNLFIKSEKNKMVVAKGLDNYIIIDEEDVLLIWPKDQEQEIKPLKKSIEEEWGDEYI